MPKGNCEFIGSGRQYLPVLIIHLLLLSMLTLGIYSPWAWVRLFRLRASHTRINGKPIIFTGTGGQLFLLGLVNGLLALITLGLYWPWAICRISLWKAQNTLVDGKPSDFVGKGGSLFLFSLIHFFILPGLTFGLYTFYAMYRYYAWKAEHVKYGGARTSFGAGFWGLMKIYVILGVILILLPALGALVNLHELDWLAPIFCIIISPWLICMFFDWETRGLVVGDEEGINHFPPVRTRALWVVLLILLVLMAVAAGGLLVKDQLKKGISETGGLSRLLEFKGKEPIPAGSVRGRVERTTPPAVPATGQKLSPPASAPTAPAEIATARKPTPDKGIPTEPLVPVWTPFAQEAGLSSGDKEREIRELNAFIEKDGQNSDAYCSRGYWYARTGDLRRAEADLTRAIEINKRSSDAFYNRGLVRGWMKNFEQAVQDFDAAIELNPGSMDAYCNRGSAYFQMGKMDLAIKDYAKALEIKPDDPDLYYNRGLVHLSQGRKPEAKADFDKAKALRSTVTSKQPAKTGTDAKEQPRKKHNINEVESFESIDITNVPIAPFLDEVKDKIDVSMHPTFQKMAQTRGGYAHFVDPFYFERGGDKMPVYEFRQFTSTHKMEEIVDWYKRKASPELDGKGDAFAKGGGSYANGPFENAAANFGVNDARNFIVLTAMKAPEDDRVTVYLFHYRKGSSMSSGSIKRSSREG